MQWEGREESTNVDDQRGSTFGGKGLAIGGGGGLLVLIIAALFGINPSQFLDTGGGRQERPPETQEEKRLVSFTKVVLNDTEEVWGDQFKRLGKRYQEPVLVTFSGQVQSACGFAEAAVGPFYCPADSRIYIDLAFFRDMERQLGAPGEFARAYVIAHEVGHHVQRLLGYSRQVDEARGRVSKTELNRLSVRLELQADFLAGVWAHHMKKKVPKYLESGDIESALNAAFQIGDDRLQKKAKGYVVPDSFTHGTSKQRQRWFMEGFKSGDVSRAKELFDLPYEQL